MSVADRIYQFADYKGVSINEISNKIEVSNGYLAKQKSNLASIGSHIIEKIVSSYPEINLEWLITGKGNMLKSERKSDFMGVESGDDTFYVPMYDAVVYGGDLKHGKSFDETITQIGTLKVSLQFKGATGAMFVRDDSMYPLYPNSSMVVYKEVVDRSIIAYGRDYIIETQDFRVVKRLLKTKHKDIILATSLNKEVWEYGEYKGSLIYEPFEIPISKIMRLDFVLGKL